VCASRRAARDTPAMRVRATCVDDAWDACDAWGAWDACGSVRGSVWVVGGLDETGGEGRLSTKLTRESLHRRRWMAPVPTSWLDNYSRAPANPFSGGGGGRLRCVKAQARRTGSESAADPPAPLGSALRPTQRLGGTG
jgi:hypothetical protein